ncbi:MAG: hypothetical protein IPG58_07195 [Acidobacteria bacterium]|nr:hypothetical protein [Acidobacteriota bacterium]
MSLRRLLQLQLPLPLEKPLRSSCLRWANPLAEGTVSKWLKAVGDKIEKDEALLEISTDKVDAEVPSPAAGTLLAINVQEGETVEVGSVLALVGAGRRCYRQHSEIRSSKPGSTSGR